MEFFIKFSFWLSAISLIIRFGYMLFKDYPRTVETKLGADCVNSFISMAWMFWAGCLLWG